MTPVQALAEAVTGPGRAGTALARPVQDKPLRHWLRALEWSHGFARDEGATLLAVVERIAGVRGSAIALTDERGTTTYSGLAGQARVFEDWARGQGLGHGSVVCLVMPNRAAYVAFWLGLTRLGCVVALINTHLVSSGLLHCISTARASHVVVDRVLYGRLAEALAKEPIDAEVWVYDDELTAAEPKAARGRPRGGISPPPCATDPALLIFTSGTTGLPKAAHVTHGRIMEWSGWFAGMMDAREDDRLYDCLPMYHSVGGVAAVGAMLVAGASIIIRRQFSASRFWADVAESGATIFQYIGELCRYLLRDTREPGDITHRLRLCCGNGLRKDVWTEFQERFRIPRILEYYAATEGNVSLYNCEGKPGAIGRIPPFLGHRFPVAIVRVDDATGEPLRDADGRCIPCAIDEAGEAIGRIDPTSLAAARRFDGYTDREATRRKRLLHVFEPGDMWFRTGDLMRRDSSGFFYFVDRLGLGFRWKGENVSAAEVAAAVMRCRGVRDAVVYGAAIPGAEGRAGMAAIVGGDDLSLGELRAHLAAELPGFARPLFVRLCRSIPLTGTFKLRAEELARDGLAVPRPPDSLWFNGPEGTAMVPCDSRYLERIAAGDIRL